MDEMDYAQERDAEYTADALREHWRRQPLSSASLYLRGDRGGLCEECGEEIPIGRRLAMPTARLCVACQTEIEIINSRRNM